MEPRKRLGRPRDKGQAGIAQRTVISRIRLYPEAGLCNRMRAIASVYRYCRERGIALDIHWVPYPALEATYSDLFEPVAPIGAEDKRASCVVCTTSDRLWMSLQRLIWKATGRFAFLKHPGKSAEQELQNRGTKGASNASPSAPPPRNRLRVLLGRVGRRCLSSLQSLRRNTLNRPRSVPLDELLAGRRGRITLHAECAYGDVFPFRELFVPRRELRERIEAITATFDSQTVGLHIRRTDHAASRQKSPLSLFLTTLDDLFAREPETTVFVCSDDASVKQLLLERYGKDRIRMQSCVLGRDHLAGLQAAVVDLYALAHTRRIFGSYGSSYSETAASLYGATLTVVCEGH